MGCRRYFAANRLEVLLDEDDSIFFTSLRTRKFPACFTTACGNPDTLCEKIDGLLTLHRSLRAYNWVFGVCWVCWESSLPPATAETNSFIQLSLKAIFGGGRGDSYTFSYLISPVSIMIAFGIE